MTNGAGKPKPAFFIAVLLVVAGLVGIAFFRCQSKKDKQYTGYVDPNIVKPDKPKGTQTESTDGKVSGLTKTEYTFEPSQKLPPVTGTGSYKALDAKKTVKFAVNVWAGWAPIIWANQGNKAGKV